jgi:hypothetical protein
LQKRATSAPLALSRKKAGEGRLGEIAIELQTLAVQGEESRENQISKSGLEVAPEHR